MFDPNQPGTPGKQRLLTLQIIVAALLMGCLTFLVISVVVRAQGGGPAAGGQPLLVYVLMIFAAGALVARFIVPRMIVAGGLHGIAAEDADPVDTTSRLWALLSTRTIVASAILEGVIFFALVVYIIDGSPIALGLALALIAALALHIPTQSWADHWLEEQRRALEHDSKLGR